MLDEKALYTLTYGVQVICAEAKGKKGGCVVNTVIQLTSQPYQLSVTVNKQNFTHDLIARSGMFSVSVLTEQTAPLIIGAFGFRSGKDYDKFAGLSYATFECGLPYLTENTASAMAVKVVKAVDVGTHTVFIGEMTESVTLSAQTPMTYAYYRTVRKGITPPKASSYIASK